MSYYLYEFECNEEYGPASEEDILSYQKALKEGKSFISKGHHGYELKFYVKKKSSKI